MVANRVKKYFLTPQFFFNASIFLLLQIFLIVLVRTIYIWPKTIFPCPECGNTIYIARILSNDLVPLHGEDQTLLNTQLILNREILPENIRRLWILNCFLDKSKERQILDLLASRGEYSEIITLSRNRNFTTMKADALNVNRARNRGLVSSFEAGAAWVILLDGSSFITSDALNSLVTMIANPNDTRLNLIPMLRLQHKIKLDMNSTYENLFPFLSGMQEPHIGVSRSFYHQWLGSHPNYTTSNFSASTDFLFDEKESSSNTIFNKKFLLANYHLKIFCGGYFRTEENTIAKPKQTDLFAA